MTGPLPLRLLAACSQPAKPDPNACDLMTQLIAVCVACDNAAVIPQMDAAVGVQGEWHQQPRAMCSSIAELETGEP